MNLQVGTERPSHFQPGYPEQWDIVSHLECAAGIPQALFAITTRKENGQPNVCFHSWSCFHGDKTAFFAVLGGLFQVLTIRDYETVENGIDYKVIKEIKEVKRARIKTYLDYVPTAKYVEGSQGIWTVPCDIALPCATQNELRLDGAKALVANGCYCVAEGANMPSTPDAIAYLQQNGILFAPAKASNAGGVATSGLEMSQNSLRLSWTFEEVDERLHNIMVNIYKTAAATAEKYGMKGNLVAGANIAGFEKIASAMMSQGIV